jgi:N-acetylglucosamine-6-phosphate deacetylase
MPLIHKKDILDFEHRRGQRQVSLRRAYKALRAGQIEQHILVNATAPEVEEEKTRRIVIINEQLKFKGLTSTINTTFTGNCSQIQEQLRSLKESYLRQISTELMKDAGEVFDNHFQSVMC